MADTRAGVTVVHTANAETRTQQCAHRVKRVSAQMRLTIRREDVYAASSGQRDCFPYDTAFADSWRARYPDDATRTTDRLVE